MNKTTYREVWKEYPEFWKTEAEFWSWLRGCLRRGIWEKSPIKLKFKNSQCTKPPSDYAGKAKSGAKCALTGEWIAKSYLEVDHSEGHKPLLSWEDVLPFINHLVPEKGTLQLVSKEAHKIKSYAERMGISFEEALCIKEAIRLCKEKKDLTFLEEREIIPATSQAKRRKQIENILLKELKNANQ